MENLEIKCFESEKKNYQFLQFTLDPWETLVGHLEST